MQIDYDHSVDLWALGIALYEMSFGYTPFDKGLDEEEAVDVPQLLDASEGEDAASRSLAVVKKILYQSLMFPTTPVGEWTLRLNVA